MAKQKTENEEYKRLLEKHEALNGFTDEALASVKFSIDDIPFHIYKELVHKLKLIPIACYLCSAANHYAVVLIAMIAALNAVHIHSNVPIASIGYE